MFKKIPLLSKVWKLTASRTLVLCPYNFRKAFTRQIPLFAPEQVHSLSFIRHLSHSNNKIMEFSQEKAKYLNMSLDEKRTQYFVKSNYVTLKDIKPWSEYVKNVKPSQSSPVCSKNPQLNEKVSIFVGNITALEVDAIVNAANNALRGGGGVDGAIHQAAGSNLLAECKTLNGCDTGDAKITGGYKLPAKYVIHTVGPRGENKDSLASCYQTSLNLALQNNLRTIAFPCISTGIYGYPNDKAAHVAIGTVRKFLEQNESSFDRVIFCLFLPVDVNIYETLMQEYFPA